MERYGIRGVVHDWYKNYLLGCLLIAKVPTGSNNITLCDKFDIVYGTAQGSCLGPLLFIIFCNDIQLLLLYGQLILFADDITVLNHQKTRDLLQFTMEHDASILSDWFKVNQLSLNITKTVLMNFGPNYGKLEIRIDGLEIPCVSSTKFLGVHLDNKLTWDTHINLLYNWLQANKHLLKLASNMLDTHSL